MTVNTLAHAHRQLTLAVGARPLSALAYISAWLDPMLALNKSHTIDLDNYDETEGTLEFASMLDALRTCIPSLYAQVIQRLQRREPIASFIETELEKLGIPTGWIDNPFSYGILLPSYYFDYQNPESYDEPSRDDLRFVLETCFGFHRDEAEYEFEIPDNIEPTLYLLFRDLETRQPSGWEDVTNMLRWLSAESGNSLIDWDEEALYSVEPLRWTPNDFDFAIQMISEARYIVDSAEEGIKLLNSNTIALTALKVNAMRLNPFLSEIFHDAPRHINWTQILADSHQRIPNLEWPALAGSPDSDPTAGPVVL